MTRVLSGFKDLQDALQHDNIVMMGHFLQPKLFRAPESHANLMARNAWVTVRPLLVHTRSLCTVYLVRKCRLYESMTRTTAQIRSIRFS